MQVRIRTRSSSLNPKSGLLVFALFGGVFVAIGLYVLLVMAPESISNYRALASRGVVTTSAPITVEQVKRKGKRDSYENRATIGFTDRKGVYRSFHSKDQSLRHGERVSVLYDPENAGVAQVGEQPRKECSTDSRWRRSILAVWWTACWLYAAPPSTLQTATGKRCIS